MADDVEYGWSPEFYRRKLLEQKRKKQRRVAFYSKGHFGGAAIVPEGEIVARDGSAIIARDGSIIVGR